MSGTVAEEETGNETGFTGKGVQMKDSDLAAEDAAVLSWHGLAPADRASDTALRRAAALWPERLAARRLMEARLYALACDSR